MVLSRAWAPWLCLLAHPVQTLLPPQSHRHSPRPSASSPAQHPHSPQPLPICASTRSHLQPLLPLLSLPDALPRPFPGPFVFLVLSSAASHVSPASFALNRGRMF